jgi:cell division protein FtsQ
MLLVAVQQQQGGNGVENGKIVSLEDRIPRLKEYRKKKANRRLILLLFLFFLSVLSVVYFLSPISHVKEITVSGNHVLKTKDIIKWSAIENGMSIWELNKDDVKKRLKKIPEIKSSVVKIQFPNRVHIRIKEMRQIGYLADGDSFEPVLENGHVIKEKAIKIPKEAPILFDFKKDNILKEMVKSLNELPVGIVNSISEIHYTPKKTDPYHITLYMNDGYEVRATLGTFSKKMVYYPSIVSQLDPKVKGVIDLEVGSFFQSYKEAEKQKDR